MALQGRHTGKRFTIGTPLRVRLLAASEVTGQIDFAPAEGSLPTADVPAVPPARERTDEPRGNRAQRRRGARGGKSRKKPPTRKRR